MRPSKNTQNSVKLDENWVKPFKTKSSPVKPDQPGVNQKKKQNKKGKSRKTGKNPKTR